VHGTSLYHVDKVYRNNHIYGRCVKDGDEDRTSLSFCGAWSGAPCRVGVIDEDRLGLDRVYVQAKRYARGNSVGRPEVQGFVGSLVGLGATKGVFVTTSLFSQHATDYARHLAQRVILIDGEKLADLMIEHNVGVRLTRAVEFKRIDEDFFSEEE
jgi:restriction endonuclease Mrr